MGKGNLLIALMEELSEKKYAGKKLVKDPKMRVQVLLLLIR
jgi:hypothetical protein